MRNEIVIQGKLTFPPHCGKSKATYAFMKLEKPNGKYPMKFEVAFFHDPAKAVAEANLRQGDVVEVLGKLEVRRKKTDAGEWFTEMQIIGEDFTVMENAQDSSDEMPPSNDLPPPAEMPPYDESAFDSGSIPF